ncbi:DUF2637 domain-containing protein [Kitasatospora sp. NPDC101801]|uniref:DUF2637 domain-containing protein n=1 Tax=Kitasatospora sp. NPDC101801 TaxID=3364103 RepID=UPI003826CA51
MTRPVLRQVHWWLIGFVAFGAVFIAAIGLGGSYLAVRDVAFRKGMGDFAPIFPIGVDAGILVLLTLDLVLTWLRIPFPLVRPTAWLLTAATIAFNAAASWPDPLGVGMHAVIPVLFIIISEAARHAVARLAQLSSDRSIEKIRLMRWVLAPGQTWRLWRRMHLWEIRSVGEAIRGEQARLTYKVLIEDSKPRKRRRTKGLPAAAYLPLQLADLGVPMEVTYESGLAAAGVDTELLSRLLAHNERAASATIAGSPDVPVPAQTQPAEIAQRKALAQSGDDTIAQDDLAQNRLAQPAELEIAQPDPAQSEVPYPQVNSYESGIAQRETSSAAAQSGDAQLPGATAGDAGILRMDSAHDVPRPDSAQRWNGQQIEEDEEDGTSWQPAVEQTVPGSRAAAVGTGAGLLITQQVDDSQALPAGWAEGFEAFVAEYRRHPEQSELAGYLHTRRFKSNKSGDGPVSENSVRRYYNQLCERFPAPSQPRLDLQDTLMV